MSLVLVRTESKFIFQQETTTYGSGEVHVRGSTVHNLPSWELGGVGVGVVRGKYLYMYIINTIIINMTTKL